MCRRLIGAHCLSLAGSETLELTLHESRAKKGSPQALYMWRLESFDHQSAVFRSKADTIAQCRANVRLSRFIGHVIKIAFGIGIIEVDCRRDHVFVHRTQGRPQARRAAGTLWMANL